MIKDKNYMIHDKKLKIKSKWMMKDKKILMKRRLAMSDN